MSRRLLLTACALACARFAAPQPQPTCVVGAAARAGFADALRGAGAAVHTGGLAVWEADPSCVDDGDCGNAKCVKLHCWCHLHT